MKKTLLIAIAVFCSISVFPARYLVQTGASGAATWTRTLQTGETLVDLTTEGKAFNAWYNATIAPDDEVWMAAGTYTLTASINITKATHDVYGGFLGTESTVSERAKAADGQPWDFVNPTVLDGNNAVLVISTANPLSAVVFDGITISNGSSSNGAGATTRDGITLNQCIITNNKATGNGGGINLNGGTISNSWVKANQANVGAGIYSNNATASVVSEISNCLIESNTATGATGVAGGIRTQGTGFTNVTNCIIRGNQSLKDGTTLAGGGGIYTNSINNTFVNCVIVNNSGSNAIYYNGGNIVNSTVANNVGQVFIASSTTAMKLINCIVWGNKNAAGNNTNITSNPANTSAVITNCGVSPALGAGWTQNNNFTLEFGNDSQDNEKGPGFISPTEFYGVPTTADQITELQSSNWNIKLTSGALDKGVNASEAATDFLGTTRPQGSAFDIGAYEVPYFTVTVTFSDGGTVSSYTSGDVLSFPKGTVNTFTITPNSGYKTNSVTYNGADVLSEMVSSDYTAPSLTGNSTLDVVFGLATGLETISSANIFSTSNGIELKGIALGSQLKVYNIAGALVASKVSDAPDMSVVLDKGIYIVRVADQSTKVIVK